jgi:hypothetical protein
MKFILIIFFMTPGVWPVSAEQVHVGQISAVFDSGLACEKAARQAELVARGIGATKVGSFCAGTKDANFKLKGEK